MRENVLEHTPNDILIETISKLSEVDRSLFDRSVTELLFRLTHFMDQVKEDLNGIDTRLNKLEGEANENES